MDCLICEKCSKEFTRQSNLNRHSETCFGSNTYPCNYCCRIFKRKDNLLRHLGSKCEMMKEIEREEKRVQNDKIKKLEFVNQGLKLELKFEKQKNKDLRDFYEMKIKLLEKKLSSKKEKLLILAKPKSTKTVNSNNNVNSNNKITVFTKIYVEERADSYIKEHLSAGIETLAAFCARHFSKTKDGKPVIQLCDAARNKFKLCDVDGNPVRDDIDASFFRQTICEVILPKTKEYEKLLEKEYQGEIDKEKLPLVQKFYSEKQAKLTTTVKHVREESEGVTTKFGRKITKELTKIH